MLNRFRPGSPGGDGGNEWPRKGRMSAGRIQRACDALRALGSREHPCVWDNYSAGLKQILNVVNKCKIMVYNDL